MNHTLKKWITTIGIIALLAGAWAFGAYQQNPYIHKQWWQSIKQTLSPHASQAQAQIEQQTLRTEQQNSVHNTIQGDSIHRLIRYPGKQPIPCPAQTERTWVLFISGQSNSANHAGQRHASRHGDQVLNYFDGQCYLAQSPLLGATGLEGESWTLLGNLAVEQGLADRVIISTNGVGGSSIEQWQSNPPFYQGMQRALDSLQKTYHVTHMLWHQGETDFIKQMPAAEYQQHFTAVLDALRQRGMNAPVYISITSQCWMNPLWREDNAIRTAQKSLIANTWNARAGVDTDLLLNELDRFDNCHFGGTGQEKFAKAWLGLLVKP
jgi:lysophospholipase L1-like esterase